METTKEKDMKISQQTVKRTICETQHVIYIKKADVNRHHYKGCCKGIAESYTDKLPDRVFGATHVKGHRCTPKMGLF